MKAIYFLLLSCFFCAPLYSEIQVVIPQWSPGFCSATCAAGLEAQFRQLPGVVDVQMNPLAGRANLIWQPQFPFSFFPVQNAMQFIGVGIEGVRVRVRGRIAQEGGIIVLISEGDNTPFQLLGSIYPVPGQYTIQFNPQTHNLSPYQVGQFMEARDRGLLVTVEGPLFEPERSPPLQLITEQTKFEEPANIQPLQQQQPFIQQQPVIR